MPMNIQHVRQDLQQVCARILLQLLCLGVLGMVLLWYVIKYCNCYYRRVEFLILITCLAHDSVLLEVRLGLLDIMLV